MLKHVKNGLLVAGVGVLAASAMAADKVSVSQSQFSFSQQQSSVQSLLGLQANNDLNVKTFFATKDAEYVRYQQTYRGIPVLFEQVVEKRDGFGNLQKIRGTRIDNIEADLGGNVTPTFDKESALNLIKNQNSPLQSFNERFYEHESVNKVIYLDAKGQARLAYTVTYFSDGLKSADPQEPMAIVDAHTGEIYDQWNALNFRQATGPGGNIKTGRYVYGEDFPAMEVDANCRMETPNYRTIDMNFRTSGGSVFQFECPENTVREINGAFSPLNDAHFFGGVIFDMYSEWFGSSPLRNQLVLRAHYSNNYENAFYSNGTMTFGDGNTRFHPLVSLDVVAHEVSHGFTSQNSGLVYRNQSGGINEAYSDMAGEAAEYFMNETNDFLVGGQIMKEAGRALRYFEDPTEDGRSIGHADDFRSGMNVHLSSGVYNRAFFHIARTEGWNTRKAFEIFTRANRVYWGGNTNFVQGACGTLEATQDLGYDINTVINAFNIVGVVCPDFEPEPPTDEEPVADFSFSADLLTVSFSDESTSADSSVVSWSWDFGDGANSSDQSPQHTYAAAGEYLVTLTVEDANGLSATASQAVSVEDGVVPDIGISLTSGRFIFWNYVDVNWTNAEGASVDVYRDGRMVTTTANDGNYRQFTRRGTYTYQVCQAGTTVCSEEETISF